MRRSSLLLTGLLLAAAPAAADVITPEEDACRNREAGAACTADGRAGTCQADECCRNDYSNGTPPETVCEPCNTCKAGAAEVSDDGGEESGCAAAPGGALGAGSLLGGLLLAFGLWRTRRRA